MSPTFASMFPRPPANTDMVSGQYGHFCDLYVLVCVDGNGRYSWWPILLLFFVITLTVCPLAT